MFAAKVALLQVHQSWQAIGWCSPNWENNCRFASQSPVAFFFLLSIQQKGRGMRPELANFSALPEAGSLHSWLDGHIVGNGGLPFWTVAKGNQSKQSKIQGPILRSLHTKIHEPSRATRHTDQSAQTPTQQSPRMGGCMEMVLSAARGSLLHRC